MKVSINRDESNIWPTDRVVIRLNGMNQPLCLFADDKKGMITRYRTDSNGKLITNLCETQIEDVYGDVEILHGN